MLILKRDRGFVESQCDTTNVLTKKRAPEASRRRSIRSLTWTQASD